MYSKNLVIVNYKNPIIRKVQHEINDIATTGGEVALCGIPGPVGIGENERADALAKLATTKTPQYVPLKS